MTDTQDRRDLLNAVGRIKSAVDACTRNREDVDRSAVVMAAADAFVDRAYDETVEDVVSELETALAEIERLKAALAGSRATLMRSRTALLPFGGYDFRDDETDRAKMPVRIGDLRHARTVAAEIEAVLAGDPGITDEMVDAAILAGIRHEVANGMPEAARFPDDYKEEEAVEFRAVVRAALEGALGVAPAADTAVITTNGTTRLIPRDEPVFLVRGQDIVGGDAVRAWATLAEAAGASLDIVIGARAHAARMDLWPKKKVPDLPKGGEK